MSILKIFFKKTIGIVPSWIRWTLLCESPKVPLLGGTLFRGNLGAIPSAFQGGFSGAMPTARSANEREETSRLCATRQGDSHQYWYKSIDCIRIFKHPLGATQGSQTNFGYGLYVLITTPRTVNHERGSAG
jgi:hypothetical protein